MDSLDIFFSVDFVFSMMDYWPASGKVFETIDNLFFELGWVVKMWLNSVLLYPNKRLDQLNQLTPFYWTFLVTCQSLISHLMLESQHLVIPFFEIIVKKDIFLSLIISNEVLRGHSFCHLSANVQKLLPPICMLSIIGSKTQFCRKIC